MRKRPKVEVAFRVPLHAGWSSLQLPLPRGAVSVEAVLVVGQAGVCQCPLEALTGDLDSKDGLLSFLGAPTAAVHHLQEGGLDPCHPVPLPRGWEAALPRCGQANLWGVRLVDDDCGVRLQGSDPVLGFCHGDQGGRALSRAPSNYRVSRCWRARVADEGVGDAGEGEEVVGFAFVAAVESSAAGEPGRGAFDGPAVAAARRSEDSVPLRAMRWVVPCKRSHRRKVVVVVALVGVQLVGSPSARAGFVHDRSRHLPVTVRVTASAAGLDVPRASASSAAGRHPRWPRRSALSSSADSGWPSPDRPHHGPAPLSCGVGAGARYRVGVSAASGVRGVVARPGCPARSRACRGVAASSSRAYASAAARIRARTVKASTPGDHLPCSPWRTSSRQCAWQAGGMCGRYASTRSPAELVGLFDVAREPEPEQLLDPNWRGCPRTVRHGRCGALHPGRQQPHLRS